MHRYSSRYRWYRYRYTCMSIPYMYILIYIFTYMYEISRPHPTWSLIGLKCWTLTTSVVTIPVYSKMCSVNPSGETQGDQRRGTSTLLLHLGNPWFWGLFKWARIFSRLQVSSKPCVFVGRVANRQPLYSSRH